MRAVPRSLAAINRGFAPVHLAGARLGRLATITLATVGIADAATDSFAGRSTPPEFARIGSQPLNAIKKWVDSDERTDVID
ncbi:unnamed protein product [Rhizoctonia solani]|uniref:Uncharacterized protein n=1 Tax=Rhizoctonia solani TaxID=456999 RepID=A0A8H3BEH7_9AGAM|nr:unnamed protein product [Rhizoctonia solani]CAE6456155.1 unnamed protein product [Rhizoctonia solani]